MVFFFPETCLIGKKLGIEELVCYSDPLPCFNIIKDPTPWFHVYAVLIQNAKDLIEQSNIIVCHPLREGNQCANFLAKLEASLDNDQVNHAFLPNGLLYPLEMDATRTFFRRE